MIAKVDPALKSFNNVIDYHEKKVSEGKAILLLNCTGERKNKSFSTAFEDICKLKPGVKNKGYHISLNLPHNENLPENKFIDLAQDYIKGMGYDDCPYLVYKHADKEHSHIHIIISSINYNGEKVNDSFYKLRSQKLSRELEVKYKLAPTVYYKFNNTSLKENNERLYFFQKALQKALRGYSTKTQMEGFFDKEELFYIFKKNLTNSDLENILGKDRYNEVGSILEKNHLFKSLYKDSLLDKLDKIYPQCKSKGEFLQLVEKEGIYIRHLSDKGKSYYVYGLSDASFYLKDARLPMKYRYNELAKSFGERSTYVLESEQKHMVYNRVILSLKNASTFESFVNILDKSGITTTSNNEMGKTEYLFKLKGYENPIEIKLSDLSSKINSYVIENQFSHYSDILSNTIINQIEFENSQQLEQIFHESSPLPNKNRDDDTAAKKTKKLGIGDSRRKR
jgi:Relaxase/Mobilisation nuclease domain.